MNKIGKGIEEFDEGTPEEAPLCTELFESLAIPLSSGTGPPDEGTPCSELFESLATPLSSGTSPDKMVSRISLAEGRGPSL